MLTVLAEYQTAVENLIVAVGLIADDDAGFPLAFGEVSVAGTVGAENQISGPGILGDFVAIDNHDADGSLARNIAPAAAVRTELGRGKAVVARRFLAVYD